MMKQALFFAFAAISLGSAPSVAVADEVPTLDYRTTCRNAGRSGVDVDACFRGELRSRESLVKEWAQFAPEDKARCVRMATNISGAESYTELFACLRAARAAKSLPKE